MHRNRYEPHGVQRRSGIVEGAIARAVAEFAKNSD